MTTNHFATERTPATPPRFDTHLDRLIDSLRADLLSMGFETELMLRDVICVLTGEALGSSQQVEEFAADILRRDDAVDATEARVENACVHALSLQQSGDATDLRLILSVLKAAGNVERIGDHAVNIAKTVRRMYAEGVWYRPLVDIGRLGDMSRRMLHDALEAIVQNDAALAQSVIDADDAVDQLYARMRRDLQAAMETDPTTVRLASSLLFVIHYLERVSDRAANVAEQIIHLKNSPVPDTTTAPGRHGLAALA